VILGRRGGASSPLSLNEPQFLYLDTRGWKTGRRHQIEIWFVEYNSTDDDNRFYIMSEHGKHSHWVQNIMNEASVFFSVANKRYSGVARIVYQESEPQLAQAVMALMKAKYGWDSGLIVELTPKKSTTYDDSA
jgi:deazaflavin-dependent oxidoreductase (nitroreductase family)